MYSSYPVYCYTSAEYLSMRYQRDNARAEADQLNKLVEAHRKLQKVSDLLCTVQKGEIAQLKEQVKMLTEMVALLRKT